MKETKDAYILLNSNNLTRVEFFSPSNLREDWKVKHCTV